MIKKPKTLIKPVLASIALAMTSFSTVADDLIDISITELAERQSKGEITAVELTQWYLDRIDKYDRGGFKLNSIMEINPNALAIASKLDEERAAGKVRGPLHGITITLKDSIDTVDMTTTAGSMALLGTKPKDDSNIAKRLRDAGAILLGKNNMSEFGGIRAYKDGKYMQNPNGWSARGGLTKNPYRINADPLGSSSGSAVAVSANMSTASIGTDAGGSVILPSSVNGVFGIRTTISLIGHDGLMPTSASFGTSGIHSTTVRDAALILNVLAGEDPHDPLSKVPEEFQVEDYTANLKPGYLKGKRIGVMKSKKKMGGVNSVEDIPSDFEAFLESEGAELVYFEIPQKLEDGFLMSGEQVKMMNVEWMDGANKYFESRLVDQKMVDAGWPVIRSVKELMEFNKTLNRVEYMKHFGQDFLEDAYAIHQTGNIEEAKAVLAKIKKGAQEYVDGVLEMHDLDAVVGPFPESFMPEAATSAGYPRVTIPMGLNKDGLPISMEMAGTAYSEDVLLGLAYAIEQHYKGRVIPGMIRP